MATALRCTRTVTGCSARCTTQTTYCRIPFCGHGAGAGVRRSQPLRTWLYSIATNTCLDAIGRRRKRILPIDYGPPSSPNLEPGQPLVESVLGRAVSGREARRRICGARRSLRAARGPRAPLHRCAPASAGDATGGPDPARGAGFSAGRCRSCWRRWCVGEQRLATCWQGRRRATPRPEPASDAALPRRRANARAVERYVYARGGATLMPSPPSWLRTQSSRCHLGRPGGVAVRRSLASPRLLTRPAQSRAAWRTARTGSRPSPTTTCIRKPVATCPQRST